MVTPQSRGYRITENPRYLESLVRAADFLARIRRSEESWLRHSFRGIPHSYHSRVAWPLLEVSELSNKKEHRQAAS